MSCHRSVVFASLLVAAVTVTRAATAASAWKVVYSERGTTTGFYDATPTTAVGGNTGKTLGEQRRIAFEKAVSIWADVVSSSVPLSIEATMTALSCDTNAAILGQASAASAVALAATNGARELAYPIALANALDGSDMEPESTSNPSGAEIFAEFNSNLGKAGCLEGTNFYLGLDGNAGVDSDFLGVVLHELGHGFGFSSFLDFATAEPLLAKIPDAYSTHILDLDRGAAWDTLSQPQLLASFKNARRVVWNGSHVTQAIPRYLVRGTPRITVSPALSGLSGMLSEHDDGPKLADKPVTGPLAVPNPATGCGRPSNAAALVGAIALVDPGTTCHPLEAVAYMQDARVAAVIAVDSTAVRPPAMINGILEGQTIAVVTIHPNDARLLSTEAVGRTVTLDGDATTYIGADAGGRLYLNMTDPVVEGTSISHWDALARNQLLMEPERSAGHIDVDLTREFMWDLGWPICGDGTLQGIEVCDDGNRVDTDSCHNDCTRNSTSVLGQGGSASTTTAPILGSGGSTSPTTTPTTAANPNGGNQVSCSCRLLGVSSVHGGAPFLLATFFFVRRRYAAARHRRR